MEYYNKLIIYVRNLLNTLVRNKQNYDEKQRLLESFKNNVKENDYIISVKNLIENWKCKAFYDYYLTSVLFVQLIQKIFYLIEAIELVIYS